MYANNSYGTRKKNLSNPTTTAKKLHLGLEAAEEGLFSAFLGSLSNDKAFQFLENGIGKYLFYPFEMGIVLVKTAIAFYRYVKAKNKNLGRLGNLLIEATAALLIVPIFVGSFVTTAILAAATPYLLIASVAVKVLVDIGLTIYHGFKFLTSRDPATKEIHLNNFSEHFIQSFLGIGLTACLTLALVFAFKIAMIVGSIVSGAGFVIGVIQGVMDHKAEQQHEEILEQEELEIEEHLEPEQGPLVRPQLSPKETKSYFYSHNRKELLVHQTDKYFFLDAEVNNKINELRASLTLLTKSDKFQESKRQNKLDALLKLQEIMNGPLASYDKIQQINVLIDSTPKNIFQSFFKAKSDVEDIFEAVLFYYEMEDVRKESTAYTTVPPTTNDQDGYSAVLPRRTPLPTATRLEDDGAPEETIVPQGNRLR